MSGRCTLRARLATTTVVVAACWLPWVGAGAQQPIPSQSNLSTPIVIANPGSYVLTRNLATSGSGPILLITAGEVQLDLNGMELTPAPGTVGIELADGAGLKLSGGGSIRGGFHGVLAGTGSQLKIVDVHFSGMTDDAVRASYVAAIDVQRSVFENISESGIAANGQTPKTGTVEDNDFCNVARAAIFLAAPWEISDDGAFFQVSNNRITGSRDGITVAGNNATVRKNVIYDAGAHGIVGIGHYIDILENTIRQVGNENGQSSAGILFAADYSRIESNDVTGALNGIACQEFLEHPVSIGNRFELNNLKTNRGFGLRFDPACAENLYGRNTAMNNNSDGLTCAGSGGGDFCDQGAANTSLGGNWMPTEQ